MRRSATPGTLSLDQLPATLQSPPLLLVHSIAVMMSCAFSG
jgi:hypothetical protein